MSIEDEVEAESSDFENVLPTAELEERVAELEERLDGLEGWSRVEGRGPGLTLGYGMGMVLAMILSWFRNGSILWCIFHGLLSWVYVIYFAFTRHP